MAPKTLDPQMLAKPTKLNSAGFKAYAASKLCNILTARSFEASGLVREKNITVISFNPGLTGTSLFGHGQSTMMRIITPILPVVFKFLSIFKSQYYLGKPERSGQALAKLVLRKVLLPSGRIYASLVRGKITFPEASSLALNNKVKDLLWQESAKMVGLSKNM